MLCSEFTVYIAKSRLYRMVLLRNFVAFFVLKRRIAFVGVLSFSDPLESYYVQFQPDRFTHCTA